MEQLKLDIQGIKPDILTDRQTDRQTDQPQTLNEKIEQSKKALKLAAEMSKIYYGEPLIVTYSGGKDSDVMLHFHALEVHQESQEIQDDAWDCTLITKMKEHSDTMVNPIYKWNDTDIWDYIRKEHIEVNPLYSHGYDRVGCIGCPLAPYHKRIKEFNDYPQYKKAYIRAFDKMLEERKKRGKSCQWKNGQEVFGWWMEEYKHNVKGQLELDFK